MKKIIINCSDHHFEKLKFEAMREQKSIDAVVSSRLFEKPFHVEVEEAYDKFMEAQFSQTMKEFDEKFTEEQKK